MIIAVTGGRPKVTGSNIAIAPGGPIPGSTPTRVPMKTPPKQQSRFKGSRAIRNPYSRLVNKAGDHSFQPKIPGGKGKPSSFSRRR